MPTIPSVAHKSVVHSVGGDTSCPEASEAMLHVLLYWAHPALGFLAALQLTQEVWSLITIWVLIGSQPCWYSSAPDLWFTNQQHHFVLLKVMSRDCQQSRDKEPAMQEINSWRTIGNCRENGTRALSSHITYQRASYCLRIPTVEPKVRMRQGPWKGDECRVVVLTYLRAKTTAALGLKSKQDILAHQDPGMWLFERKKLGFPQWKWTTMSGQQVVRTNARKGD